MLEDIIKIQHGHAVCSSVSSSKNFQQSSEQNEDRHPDSLWILLSKNARFHLILHVFNLMTELWYCEYWTVDSRFLLVMDSARGLSQIFSALLFCYLDLSAGLKSRKRVRLNLFSCMYFSLWLDVFESTMLVLFWVLQLLFKRRGLHVWY